MATKRYKGELQLLNNFQYFWIQHRKTFDFEQNVLKLFIFLHSAYIRINIFEGNTCDFTPKISGREIPQKNLILCEPF